MSGRRGPGRDLIVVLLAALVVLVAPSCSDDVESGPAATSTTTTGAVADPSRVVDWPGAGRDLDNSRTAVGNAISTGTVDQLEVAWTAPMSGALSTVPLIIDDSVYVQDGYGTIAAFDRETGAQRWRTPPSGYNIGPFGVAVAGGRVFAMFGSTGVVAVDEATGEELWSRAIVATPSTGVGIQPVVVDDLVLVSTVPISISGIYQGGDRGILHALDAATGRDRWTFDTIESPDLWGNPDVNSGGGAWYPPAVDTDRDIVYWGVANPAPFPGTPDFPNGSSRPGPNLYTNSVVALDLATGSLDWYHQAIPHDLFDRDLVHTMIARPPEGDPVVVATGKLGRVLGLDPESGELLWDTPVGEHGNDELKELTGPTEVVPGTYGGVLTPPSTADGVVYVATVNAPNTLVPDQTSYFGAELGVRDGEVVAVDAATGAVLWSTAVPGDPLGGTAVLGDLVFTALVDGRILALDRATGESVWETRAPGGINGWMAAAGDLVVVPVGMADPPQLVAYRVG